VPQILKGRNPQAAWARHVRVACPQRRAFERLNELNALHVFRLKARIVGDKEIDTRSERSHLSVA
jgi:hypothetical protein